MKTKLLAVLAVCLLVAVSGASAAPVLFNNAMTFDDEVFGLIDFEAPSQSSYTDLNTFLDNYDASLVGGDFAHPYNTATINNGGTGDARPISDTRLLYGPGGIITIHFDTPVTAVGGFWLGLTHVGSPESNGLGNMVTVTLDNGGGTYNYFPTADLLPSAEDKINGFFGVFENTYKISEIEFMWNRDNAGIDNIYFSSTVDSVLNGGLTAVTFANKNLIPLPALGSGVTVPEPASLLLIGCGIIGLVKRLRKK
ncbi:MAG: PEP-CTERM sorting domain-containing protein [Candidatus Auribacterota bacterium]